MKRYSTPRAIADFARIFYSLRGKGVSNFRLFLVFLRQVLAIVDPLWAWIFIAGFLWYCTFYTVYFMEVR